MPDSPTFPDNPLAQWLESAKTQLRSGWDNIRFLTGPFGIHGVQFGMDYDGEGEIDEDGFSYAPVAWIGFNLPDGVYAEIEDGTYGSLQSFRIYRDE